MCRAVAKYFDVSINIYRRILAHLWAIRILQAGATLPPKLAMLHVYKVLGQPGWTVKAYGVATFDDDTHPLFSYVLEISLWLLFGSFGG